MGMILLYRVTIFLFFLPISLLSWERWQEDCTTLPCTGKLTVLFVLNFWKCSRIWRFWLFIILSGVGLVHIIYTHMFLYVSEIFQDAVLFMLLDNECPNTKLCSAGARDFYSITTRGPLNLLKASYGKALIFQNNLYHKEQHSNEGECNRSVIFNPSLHFQDCLKHTNILPHINVSLLSATLTEVNNDF